MCVIASVFDVRGSVHHSTIHKERSNKMQQCIKILFFYIYMEKISWTDHVRNEDVLHRVKEQRNILHEIRKREG